MKTGGRDRSDEPSDEVVGLEDDSAGAVAPDALQPELEPAVVAAQEAVLSQWWPSDVTAEPLELPAVAAVDALLGVEVDAAHEGDGLARLGLGLGLGESGPGKEEAQGGLAGAVAGDRDALGSGGVAGSEARLIESERGRLRVGLELGIERTAMGSQDLLDALGGAASDLGDLGAGRCRQRVEDELAFGVTNVDAVEGEKMEVDVQSERTVRPLDRGDRAGVGVGDAAKVEIAFGAPAKRASELGDERAQHLRAEPPVVTEQGAQAPRK